MTPQITLPREVVEQAVQAWKLHCTHHENGCVYMDGPLADLDAALTKQGQEPKITGWPAGLMQDDCRGLSRWLSSRPDALYKLRELYAEQVQPSDNPDVRELRKWLNEGQTTPIDKVALAKVLARVSYLQGKPAQGDPLIPFKHGCKWCGKAKCAAGCPALLQSNAERVPLTDEQFNDLVMQHLGPHALTGGKMSVYDAFLLAVRATESAHGITKGRQ